MSRLLIDEYLREIDRRRRFSGTSTESVIRGAFEDLLKAMSRARSLHFVPELEHKTRSRPASTPTAPS